MASVTKPLRASDNSDGTVRKRRSYMAKYAATFNRIQLHRNKKLPLNKDSVNTEERG